MSGLSAADLTALQVLAERIRTQDNAITADPVFTVEARRRVWGFDEAYCETYGYVNPEDGNDTVTSEEDSVRFAVLDELWYGVHPDRYERVHYRDEWETVQSFLTRAAAEEYRAREAHNLGKTRIYVQSGYRNHEWQFLRRLLGGMLVEELTGRAAEQLRQTDPDPDDMPKCVVSYGADGHDGVGWYYWDAEYPDEGSCGAFKTLAEAVLHASTEGGYMIGEIRETATLLHAAEKEG